MTRTLGISILALATTLATGCLQDEEALLSDQMAQDEFGPDEIGEVAEVGDAAEPAESQFLADARYVRGLIGKRDGRAMKLDFADPVQYRFIMERLQRGGRTRQASPILHISLDKLREEHLARPKGAELKSALTDHYLHMVDETWVSGANDENVHGRAYATEADGTIYSDLDVGLWETDGTLIGSIGYYSESNGGTEVFAETSGVQNFWAGDSDERRRPRRCFQADSLSCHQIVNGPFECTYASRRAQCVYPQSIDVVAPVDSEPTTPDDVITVCLDRDWLVDAYDCDYSMVNTGGKLLMPLVGEIDYGFPIVLDPVETGKPLASERSYHISLSLAHDGGRCTDVGVNDAVTNFWDFVTVKNGAASNSVLAWNIPQANFGSRCFQHQERSNFNLNVSVQVDTGAQNSGRVIGAAFITPAGAGNFSPGSATMPQVRFAYSCLAEGTQISLADGTTMDVESVGLDTLVSSPAADLYVTNSSIGVERIPMVRVRDDQGHSLLLTEGHPIITPNGPVMAGELSVGDRISTDSGTATLTFVGREDYAGKVHNLNLGNDRHSASTEAMYDALPEGATMYANGILVGDGRMQGVVQDRANQSNRPLTIESSSGDDGLGTLVRQSVAGIIDAVVEPYR